MIVDMPDAEPWQAEVRTGKLSRLEAYGQDAGGSVAISMGFTYIGCQGRHGAQLGHSL